MSEALQALASYITEKCENLVVSSNIAFGELTLATTAESLIALVTFLRDDPRCGFINITDVCGVDYPSRVDRFDVVYHFLAPRQNQRIRLKLQTNEDKPVPSLCPLFPGADWFEREAWDLYGIMFTGHPDLRRILTDYGFEGHPLRKDFPVTGFVEVRYDDTVKRVVYEPVELKQEFRSFDFLSPWEGTDYVLPGDEKSAK
ncbi:NADH-quinone oxidoreductase subunit C [Allorhizobium terrae]|uniref:NADH-quinone oxidoreductase subunit C n=1 Tax=Allorhizobium terrae TaxID=1848972 RepID=A0A4S4A344_9HYPH|nr:NADH-quinone oxidoreductase subunit C [Allorhizobium terrae]THF52332.1 NADH-quinone oxidoreductase subunit C [Allorhizobium terrae]TWD57454.1 NADH dehydrogenase subunit C [Agrobacterium vitis]